jgi:hypothetical protein
MAAARGRSHDGHMSNNGMNGTPTDLMRLYGDARMAAAIVGARRASRQRARSGAPPGVLASGRWRTLPAPPPRYGR